jgi:hypothetical protein
LQRISPILTFVLLCAYVALYEHKRFLFKTCCRYVEAGNPCNNLDLKAPEGAASWATLSLAVVVLWGLALVA